MKERESYGPLQRLLAGLRRAGLCRSIVAKFTPSERASVSKFVPMRFLATLLVATAALAQPRVELRPIASGLELPVAIAHAGDARLYIVLQRGRIVMWNGTTVSPTSFLDIRSLVYCGSGGDCGERGLLGLAFHPRFAQNRFFYVYYTDRVGDIVLARYTANNDGTAADPSSRVQILTIGHSEFPNHNGGQLAFGPDGYLYLGPGDGGFGGDPHNNAQNLRSHLGKLLRIDVDGGPPYGIPPSNPFAHRDDARPEIWAYGLRNPWCFSFDRSTGDLLVADVGQGDWEEVDLQRASSIGGENYGWRRVEGTHCFNPSTNCQDPSFIAPIVEYGHDNGACSVTGGYRYRGARSPRLRGMYIYGDYCNGVIWGATENSDGTWTSRVLFDAVFFISTFGEDAAGELYVADHTGRTIYQIVDQARKRRAVQR